MIASGLGKDLLLRLKSCFKQGVHTLHVEQSYLVRRLPLCYAMEYIDLAKNGHKIPRFYHSVVLMGNQVSMMPDSEYLN